MADSDHGPQDRGITEPDSVDPSRTQLPKFARRRTVWRGVLGVAASLLCIAVVAVPLVAVLTSATSKPPANSKSEKGPAEHAVISALSTTTASGSFDMTYAFSPPTSSRTPDATPTTCVPTSFPQSAGGSGTPGPLLGSGTVRASGTNGGGCVSSQSMLGSTITGQGTIDTNPFGMVAVSQVGGLGAITIRDNGTDVWEYGGADYGLAASPNSGAGGGASLSGFAGLAEGTLGPREGAMAMMDLASPTGYLDLDQSMVSTADEIGTGTVDGVAVTVFQITIDPAQEAQIPGLNPEESATITQAQTVLKKNGYIGTTVKVSIDGAGYIRETQSAASFLDGSVLDSQSVFSDFGCAGEVLMPGQTGDSSPPQGCVSPDNPNAVAPSPTVSAPSSSTTVSSTTTTTSATTTTSTSATTTTTTSATRGAP